VKPRSARQIAADGRGIADKAMTLDDLLAGRDEPVTRVIRTGELFVDGQLVGTLSEPTILVSRETSGDLLAKLERRLSAAEYATFIGSDEGQALLERVAVEDRTRRRESARHAD
jgi:hypothetical protein